MIENFTISIAKYPNPTYLIYFKNKGIKYVWTKKQAKKYINSYINKHHDCTYMD